MPHCLNHERDSFHQTIERMLCVCHLLFTHWSLWKWQKVVDFHSKFSFKIDNILTHKTNSCSKFSGAFNVLPISLWKSLKPENCWMKFPFRLVLLIIAENWHMKQFSIRSFWKIDKRIDNKRTFKINDRDRLTARWSQSQNSLVKSLLFFGSWLINH